MKLCVTVRQEIYQDFKIRQLNLIIIDIKMMKYFNESEFEGVVKIITNLETYNEPLPKGKNGKNGWFYRTLKWRLFTNLKIQPENDPKYWEEHRKALAFYELDIPELKEKMEKLCNVISTGYSKRYEIEFGLNVPLVMKSLIGKILYVEPSIFKDTYANPPPDSPKMKKIKWKNAYLPSRMEDGQIMDTNASPPTDSLTLESVASLSD